MQEILKHWAQVFAAVVEAAAGLIVVSAALQGGGRALMLFAKRQDASATEDIRVGVARWLTLALELTLGADILLTAVWPSWSDIGKMGAIMILRTALNYFLGQEIRRAKSTPPSPS